MEQTIQEAVQQASGAGQDPWVHWAGVIISFITLTCIIGFRWWDGRTRLNITFLVRRANPVMPDLRFTVLNKSKVGVFAQIPYLKLPNGEQLPPEQPRRSALQPTQPRSFTYRLPALAALLLQRGYKGTADLKFVVPLSTGTPRQQPIRLNGLEEWANTSTVPQAPTPTDPRPRWRRMFDWAR